MKPLLISSLALNFGLVGALIYVLSESTSISSRSSTSQRSPSSSVEIRAPAAAKVVGNVRAPDLDEQAWLGDLKAKGYSAATRLSIAAALVREKYHNAQAAILRPAGGPRWAQNRTSPTDEQRRQLKNLNQVMTAEIKALLGADYDVAMSERPRADGLAADKAAAVDRINSDYRDMRRSSKVRPGSAEERKLEAERQADLRAALGLQQADDYFLYHSSAAQELQNRLGELAVSDQDYENAMRAKWKLDEENSGKESFAYRLKESTVLEQTLGIEVAAKLAMKGDATFREVGEALSPAVSDPKDLLARYHTWLQFHSDLGALQKAGDAGQAATLAQTAYQTLTRGLSAESRRRFDATQTGAFLLRIMQQ